MSRGPAPGPVAVLRGHHSDVQALAFHPTLDVMYTGDASGQLRVWETASRRTICSRKLHTTAAGIIGLYSLLHRTACLLISQGREGTVRIWVAAADGSLPDSHPLREFCTGCYTFCRMSVLQTGVALSTETSEPHDAIGLVAAPGGEPSVAELWGIQSASRLVSFTLPPGVIYGMCMSMHVFQRAGETHLAVGYEDGNVAVWRAAAPTQPLLASRLHQEPVMALAIDESACGGVSGSAENQLVCFRLDLDARTCVVREATELHKEGIADIALRGDGRIFATAGWDGKVRMYNYRKATCLAILKYHTAAVTTVAFSGANVLASAARDGAVALWSLY